ncbi:MAG: hypothetical protein U0S50_00710 [Sphingopyxis sp.]|uniref:hypothetical protein n=1 Tax=Sphingopyxis sp. TaxID=1908224 RepID=UPI002ABCE40A|nr:hypothetical protein [Sphingopyxis sp.]MDZ3830319.1 hypothetical protein [Sphingopyxis sp.]
MKAFFPVLLVAGAMSASPVLAAEAAVSPLIGTWAVDVASLPIPPEARPKSVTITYSDAGAGQWRTLVDVTLPDGKMVQAKSVWSPDGKPVHVEGNLEADTAATRMPEPNVMITALALGGVPGSMRTYTVSPDGRTMTETVVFFTSDGTPGMRTNLFTRVE